MCFFQFGAAIPLVLFTATAVSRLKFLGTNAAGVNITLVGGIIASTSIIVSSLILWVMSYQGIAQEAGVLRALYYLTFAIGGVGYSVPLGLLISGIAISSGFMKLLPKWVVVFGIILAVVGELSFLSLIFPKLLLLIPLTRFPAFIWLIIVGFKLPKKNNILKLSIFHLIYALLIAYAKVDIKQLIRRKFRTRMINRILAIRNLP